MKLVDLPFFIELGSALEQAARVDARGRLFDAFVGLFRLRNQLSLLQSGQHAKVSAAAHDLAELVNLLDLFERRYFRDAQGNWTSPPDDQRSEYELSGILSKINQFRTVLIADLRTTASFTVTDAGIFDVNQLVNCAHRVLSAEALAKLDSELLAEIDASGKCLAFNLPTASGFHAMRAVERALKRYLLQFIAPDEMSRINNWGNYIGTLERRLSGPDPKPSVEAIALLRQIKDIYRNPVIHPERTLLAQEAATLFHSTVAAINRMAFELADQQPSLPDLFSTAGGAAAVVAALPNPAIAANEAA